MLHRLPEAEVDPERQRRDELSQPNMRAISLASHTPTLPGPQKLDEAAAPPQST